MPPTPPATPTLSAACLQKGCQCSQYNDSVCDAACNNAECNYDGNDCGCPLPTSMIVYGLGSVFSSCAQWTKPGQSCGFQCKTNYLVFSTSGTSSPNGTTTCRATSTNLGGAWDRMVCEAPCPAIPNVKSVQNGQYLTDCANTPSRSDCAFSCNAGFTKGSGKTTCNNGLWQMQAQCFPACSNSTLGTVAHGHYTCTDANITVGNTCSFECNTGYTKSGSATCQAVDNGYSTCLSSSWLITATCNPDCARLDLHAKIPNILTQWDTSAPGRGGPIVPPCTEKVAFGSSCSVECDRFYVASGSTTATCGANGQWSISLTCMPPCTVIPHTLPGSTSTCVSNMTKVPYQSTCADWTCATDHLMNENCPGGAYGSKPTCGVSSGTLGWSSAPYCFRPCTKLDLWGYTADAVVGCSGITGDGHILHGSKCEVVCQSGYTKIGTDPICYDGNFIPNGLSNHSQCVKTATTPAADTSSCAFNQLQDPPNGKLSRTDGWICSIYAPAGFTVSFTCNTGYTLVGTGVVTCGGNWVPSGQCVLQDSCAATNIAYASAQCPKGNLGDVCEVVCASGYVLVWPADDVCGALYPTIPICTSSPTTGRLVWANLPTCVEACNKASGCTNNLALCDYVCAETTSQLNCGGPSCSNDNGKCAPITGTIDYVEISSVIFHYTTSRRLGSSSWVGTFPIQDTDNYFAYGRTNLGVNMWQNASDQWGEARFGSADTVRYGKVLAQSAGYVPQDPYTRAGDFQLRVFPDASNAQPLAVANITHTLVHQMYQEMVPIGTKDACDRVNASRVSSSSITASSSFPPSEFNATRQLQFRTEIGKSANVSADQVEILGLKWANGTAVVSKKGFQAQETVGSLILFRFINLPCASVSSTVSQTNSVIVSGALGAIGVLATPITTSNATNPSADPTTVPFSCPGQLGAPTGSVGLAALQAACQSVGFSGSAANDDRDLWRRVAIAFIILFGVSFFVIIILVVLLVMQRSSGGSSSRVTQQVQSGRPPGTSTIAPFVTAEAP